MKAYANASSTHARPASLSTVTVKCDPYSMLPQRSHGTVASIVYVKVIFHECPMTHCRESAYTILSIGWCPFFLSSSTLAGTGSAAEEGHLRIIALCFSLYLHRI